MGVQVTNNAFSTLFSALTAVATTMTVASGHGARFPSASVASGNYFYITLIKSSGVTEIVKVTDRSTDVFTIVRSQDGTTATTFTAGDRVELRPVAALFNELPNRLLIAADYTDLSVTNGKLDNIVSAIGPVGGLGKFLTATVNSKGRITALTETNGIVQTNTFAFTTSGATQTWTKPTSAGSLVRIQCWGGGGGGGRAASGGGGQGGGGGGYLERWMSLADVTSTVSVVVGGGGAGSAASNTAGTAGENTTFGAYVTAYAGGGGGGAVGGGGGGGGGEMSAGVSGTSTSPGAGGAIGGGHGAFNNSGSPTATSTVRGVLTTAYTEFPATAGTLPTMPWGFGNDARSIFGGGGGGGGNSGAVSGTESTGGFAVFGGGGGGGGYNGSQANNGAVGGTSLYGGSGGSGATDSATGSNGTTPAGGGGGSELGNGGAGGNGRVIVTVYV
jgi:hypothetical protein